MSLVECQKLTSIYDIRNQEWRVLRKYVGGEVFFDPHHKIYEKEFLKSEGQFCLKCFLSS